MTTNFVGDSRNISTFERVWVGMVKAGLWLIPVIPLYVSSSMLFPFITGKNFAFRILVEILLAFWVSAALAWPRYRPSLTPIFKLVTIFIVVIFLADLFSPNPYRSFFSNYERMEGFMMLFHLYLYFLMLVSVFKTKKDWLIFFHSTLAVSIVVGFIGLLQKFGYRISLQGGFRVDSTIGNPSYLAAYLSFHVWILALLIKNFWQKAWLRLVYGAAILYELTIIYFTATRGAIVALVLSAPLLVLFLVLYWKQAFPGQVSYRKWAVAVLALFVAAPVVFWQIRDSQFIRTSPVLSRLASISVQDRTTQSRFSIWKMSLKGAMDRPILGWGQENYYLVFQKYYDPKLYSSEPWFDRSHNVVLDWLIHTGIAGLLSFFSILGAAFWLLWNGVRKGKVDLWAGVVTMVAFVSYLIQNIFVFDNLNTYLLFFAFLAYTNGLVPSEPEINVVRQEMRRNNRFRALVPSLTIVFLVVVSVAGYFLHLKPILTSRTLLYALRLDTFKGPADQIVQAFKQSLSYNSFGSTEVREQIANLARKVASDERFSAEQKVEFLDAAIDELKKEIGHPAKDIKHMLFLASLLSIGASSKPQYALEAEILLKDAIRISPAKQIIYFELAQLYMRQQRFDEAVALLKTVVDIEPGFMAGKANLIIAAALAGKTEVINEVKNTLNLRELNEDSLSRIGTVYRSLNDLTAARPVYEKLIEVAPQSPQYHATFAAIIANFGEFDRAIEETELASKLDESFAKEAATFLQMLKDKKAQSQR